MNFVASAGWNEHLAFMSYIKDEHKLLFEPVLGLEHINRISLFSQDVLIFNQNKYTALPDWVEFFKRRFRAQLPKQRFAYSEDYLEQYRQFGIPVDFERIDFERIEKPTPTPPQPIRIVIDGLVYRIGGVVEKPKEEAIIDYSKQTDEAIVRINDKINTLFGINIYPWQKDIYDALAGDTNIKDSRKTATEVNEIQKKGLWNSELPTTPESEKLTEEINKLAGEFAKKSDEYLHEEHLRRKFREPKKP